eukprot:gene10487-10555_t
MSETLYLSAEVREKVGKGASRVLRRAGRIPAVVYGDNQTPVAVHLEEKALKKALSSGHFFNSIVELSVDGEVLRTLPKDWAPVFAKNHATTKAWTELMFQRNAITV